MSLITEKKGYTLTARINRPAAMNAVNFGLMEQLESLLSELERDEKLRLFILTGTGKSFIAGGDLREFHSIKDAEGARKMSARMMKILQRIEELPCWTLAAINGHAYGGGWETMLSFDFRIARESAKFGFTQGKFYLPPGWGGLTRLSNAVGKPLADYWLASQKVIDAKTACQHGLIQDIFPDDEYENKLEKLTQDLTLNDRTYIGYMKRNDHGDITKELEPFSRFWESDEHINRVTEFLESRKK